jgi:hypothetical protein
VLSYQEGTVNYVGGRSRAENLEGLKPIKFMGELAQELYKGA